MGQNACLWTTEWLSFIYFQLLQLGGGSRSRSRPISFGHSYVTNRYTLCNPYIRKHWYPNRIVFSGLKAGLHTEPFSFSILSMNLYITIRFHFLILVFVNHCSVSLVWYILIVRLLCFLSHANFNQFSIICISPLMKGDVNTFEWFE